MSARYLIDTCGWIELAIDGECLSDFEPYFTDPTALVVPTVIQFELYKWVCRERDELLALEFVALTEQGTVVPLTAALALLAADLASQHQLAMADAIIYATARSMQVPVVTCDAHFAALPGVHYFAKPRA